jgi:hypothetical protein
MPYLTIEDFQRYTNVHEDTLQEVYLVSAENIIKTYLGYDLALQSYTDVFAGKGTNKIQLKSKPIHQLIQVKYDGAIIPPSSFVIQGEFIAHKSLVFAEGSLVTATYRAGYDIFRKENNQDEESLDGCRPNSAHDDEPIDGGGPDSSYDDEPIDGGGPYPPAPPLPNIIKLTGLRIAALLQTEGDSNIGVTGKSFGDSGSRTFVNYTNFDKYLLPISKHRLLGI